MSTKYDIDYNRKTDKIVLNTKKELVLTVKQARNLRRDLLDFIIIRDNSVANKTKIVTHCPECNHDIQQNEFSCPICGEIIESKM